MAEARRVRTELRSEIATISRDLDIFSGWIRRLENPDPVLRSESRGKGLRLYDEILRDAHAFSVLQTRILAVVGKEWQIEPAQAGARRGRPKAVTREQEIADFITQALLATNFDQARQELLLSILYGFYVLEVIWGLDAQGRIVPARLIPKHPRRFCFTAERELRLLTPAAPLEGEPVPERKFICMTWGSVDNPYGQGLGQKLWWPVWFKKHGIKFWVIFAEKFGSPTAIGKYPPGSDEETQKKLLEALGAIQQDSGIIVPETMVVELLEAARTSSVNTYESLCEFMDRQISKAVLGQTLTTEIGDTGSYAAAKVHGEVRDDLVKADADLLCECLNETLIKWIVDYNFPGVQDYPKIWINTEPEEDLKTLAERDKILLRDIGGFDVPVSYIRDTYGIPAPEEGEETIGLPPPKGPGNFAERPRVPGAERPGDWAEARGFTQDQEAIDRLAERISRRGAKLSGMLEPVLALVKKANSFEEVLEGLYELYPHLDTARMEELVRQATFAADLWGYLTAKEGRNG
jgi:phage gp29-like protein